MARGHHVGLQQGPLQVHVMVTQGLVHSSQDLAIRGGLLRFRASAQCTFLGKGGHDCEGQHRLKLTGVFWDSVKSAWGKCLHLSQGLWGIRSPMKLSLQDVSVPKFGLTFSVTY